MKQGKFVIPQYLHSQLFEEMQASLAYLRSSIVEVNRRHVESSEQTQGGQQQGGKLDDSFFDKPPSSSSSSSSTSSSTSSTISATPVGLPTSALDVPAPLIPLSAFPPPPPHQNQPSDSVNAAATNQLQNMLGMMVTSDSFLAQSN